MSFLKSFFSIALCCLVTTVAVSQASIKGIASTTDGAALGFTNVALEGTKMGASANADGEYQINNVTPGEYTIVASFLGYMSSKQTIRIAENQKVALNFTLNSIASNTDEIVVTGTLKPVKRLESPVPVEVYSPTFFKKNPTPNIYEALQNVNGVRPQLNCQVCNTGDIHINGLEGPYTMVLIDGMPIVSSLATVYGLSGIPNVLVERMEVVKGPASSLYGSEAIGGLINIITKNPTKAPTFTADVMATTWGEVNTDLGAKFNIKNKVSVLTGVNYFHFNSIIDNNDDNFTDMALQQRVSVFQKWNFKRKSNKVMSLAGRYYFEDRWGGELDWTRADRGGDEVYGEAITTKRWEILGQYQLPTTENIMFSFSYNEHDQNSVYGDVPYIADQKIGFGQFTWDKQKGKHDMLLGTALRYTYYDDNTTATANEAENANEPDEIWLPGIFLQDEITFTPKHKLLLGARYDYNDVHGNIFTPRLAYKWSVTPKDIIRLNAGTGFRVVNLFTEDHAALTGARDVIIQEELEPEQSYNINLNYTKKMYFDNGAAASIELAGWYTYFTNVIFPDYDTDPNAIIYDNLDGYAITKGASLNADVALPFGLSLMAGGTLMDVTTTENDVTERQLLTERFTGTWSVSYKFLKDKLTVDYTGNVYSPMLLPVLGDTDPRPDESPWWSIQNIQLTYSGVKNFEFYGGVKNLLNWTPWKNQDEPIIARSNDPFDREVTFDADGNAVATPNNPNALTFDPSYVYGPNQGIRGFVGVRYNLR